MSNEPHDIVAYLEDLLSDSEREEFDRELAHNSELQEQVEWFRDLRDGLAASKDVEVAGEIELETLQAITDGTQTPTPAQWRHILLNEETRLELAMLRTSLPVTEKDIAREEGIIPDALAASLKRVAYLDVRQIAEKLLGSLLTGKNVLEEQTRSLVDSLQEALSLSEPAPAYFIETGPEKLDAVEAKQETQLGSVRIEVAGVQAEITVRKGSVTVQCSEVPETGLQVILTTDLGDRLTETVTEKKSAVFRELPPGTLAIYLTGRKKP